MTDHPIIFSAPMILALLAGRKTMTRRLAWGKPVGIDVDEEAARDLRRDGWKVSGPDDTEHRIAWRRSPWQRVQPGDRLWVREGWKPHSLYDAMKPRDMPPSKIFYLADEAYSPSGSRGRPSIHMPRAFSRLTLIVTATKIERLQEISEVDANAEGMPREFRTVIAHPRGFENYSIPASYRGGFVNLWNNLHDEPHQWEDNPEVVGVSFTVHKQNIDSLAKEAA